MNALANPEVGKYLDKHFVSAFQKVATFRIVNGQKQGGNVAGYFCAPDGRVLHTIAGPVDAATMLREAKWVVDSAKKAVEESKRTETAFKLIFRRLHAERLRQEYGLVVEAVAFDAPETLADGPLSYRDPSGQPLLRPLPPPPIDGPDVSLHLKQQEAAAAPGAKEVRDRCGKAWRLPNGGQVHQILAAHSMVKIEKLYATVFENILGEKVSTAPVVTIGALRGGAKTDLCIGCGIKEPVKEE